MGCTMLDDIARVLDDRTGATAVEYGLITALLSVAALGTWTTLGESLELLFVAAGLELNTAAAAALAP